MKGVDLKCRTPLLYYSDEDVRTILAQYDRKPENIDKDIDAIKTWFKTQPHIPVEPSARLIASFLIMNKFSIEKTKDKLELNFTIKSLIPEYYNLLPKDNQIIVLNKAYQYFPLPKLTKNLNRVIIGKLQNPEIFDVHSLMVYIFMTLDMRANFDLYNSEEHIIDLANATLGVLSKFGPMHFQKCFLIVEKIYANRLASLHIINAPSYASTFINLLKATMTTKLRDRLFVHKNVEELYEYYPKEILPEEYGGKAKSIYVLNENWIKYLKENQDFLEEIHNIKVNEELRPNKLVNDEILGYHGNFRKLEVD